MFMISKSNFDTKEINIQTTMKRQIYNFVVLFTIMVLCPVLSIAQPKPGGGNGNTPPDGNGTPISGGGAPIDGGLSILLTISALYGGNKVYQWTKNK